MTINHNSKTIALYNKLLPDNYILFVTVSGIITDYFLFRRFNEGALSQMKKYLNFKRSKNIQFFVSIGAGLNQIPLIREAKKQGFNIIGVDYNPAAPGFVYCDLKIQESIVDYNDIYHKLQELLVDGDIRGVMTKSYGAAITTTAFLSSKFNIPFLPKDSCDNFIDKIKMKNLFKKHKIPTSEILSSSMNGVKTKIDSKRFPVIFKPSTGHGKIGVKLLNSMHELKNHIKSNELSGKSFILEDFIRGDEIIALGIVNNSQYHLVDITDKKTSPLPNFVDYMHISPSKYYHLFDNIQEIGQAVSNAFSIVSSPLIMELIVTDTGKMYLIEAVPEFGGEFLTDILVPTRTGYNFIGEAIKAHTRTGFNPPTASKKIKKSVVVQYIIGSKGILASCNPQGPSRMRQTIFSRILKEIGSAVTEPVNNLDRIGVVAVKGKNVEEAAANADKAAESFNIRIKE